MLFTSYSVNIQKKITYTTNNFTHENLDLPTNNPWVNFRNTIIKKYKKLCRGEKKFNLKTINLKLFKLYKGECTQLQEV